MWHQKCCYMGGSMIYTPWSTFINWLRLKKGIPKVYSHFPSLKFPFGVYRIHPYTVYPTFQTINLVSIWIFEVAECTILLCSWVQRSFKCWNDTNFTNAASTLLLKEHFHENICEVSYSKWECRRLHEQGRTISKLEIECRKDFVQRRQSNQPKHGALQVLSLRSWNFDLVVSQVE